MDSQFEKFIEIYNNSSPELKNFIDSDTIGLFVEKLISGKSYLKLKQKLIVLVTNRLLDIISEEELLASLIKIGIASTDTETLFSEIKNFIDNTANGIGVSTVIKPIEEEIAETEAVLDTINPIRTMASDSGQVNTEEKVHASTQSAILN